MEQLFNYSYRKELTGFARAALYAWKPVVNSATTNAIIEAIRKMCNPSFVLKAKFCNQLFIKYQASGQETIEEMINNKLISFVSNPTTWPIDDPITFLIPISLVLCSVVKEASPNKPNEETNIARSAKIA